MITIEFTRPLGSSEADQALAIIRDVFNLRAGKWSPQLSRDLLERTAHFRAKQTLDGAASVDASNRLLLMLWAIAGDAHLALKNPLEAARAYQIGAGFHDTAFFGDIYARIVLKHRLSDHYETARTAIENNTRAHRVRSFRIRWISHCLSFCKSPIHYGKYMWDSMLRTYRLRELDRRIQMMRV